MRSAFEPLCRPSSNILHRNSVHNPSRSTMVRKDVGHFSFRTWIFWWWLHNNTRSRHYSMTLHATDSMAQQAITCNGTAHHTTPRHNHTIIGTDVIIIGLILYLRIMNKTYHIAIVAQPLHAMQGPAIACHSEVLHSTASHAKSRHNKTLLHSTPIHARTCHCTTFRGTTQCNLLGYWLVTVVITCLLRW